MGSESFSPSFGRSLIGTTGHRDPGARMGRPWRTRVLLGGVAAIFGLFALVVGMVAAPHPAFATGSAWCAGPGGTKAGGPCVGGRAYPTIEEAVSHASAGDDILVAAGDYSGVTFATSVNVSGGFPGGEGGYQYPASSTSTSLRPGATGFGAIVEFGAAPTLNNLVLQGADVETGTLTLQSSVAISGAFQTANGSELNLFGNREIAPADVTFSGGGFVRVVGGAVTVRGILPVPAFEVAAGALIGPGVLKATSFRWSGGELNGAGADGPGGIEIPAGATMNITGPNAKILRQRHIENLGTITADASSLASADAVVTNRAGALFDLAGDVGFGLFPFESGNQTFVNEGTLRKSAGSGAAIMEMFVDQRGTVQVQSGELRTTAGIDTVGSFNLSAGTQLTFRSDPTILREPTAITGDGLVSSQARVTVMGTVPIEHFELTSIGNVNGPGTLRATSTFRWSGGELRGAGADGPGVIEIPVGSTMAITGPEGKIVRQRHIENYGTITADATFLASGDAAVANHAGARFDMAGDVGVGLFAFESGGRTFVNEGTLRKSAGTGPATLDMFLDQRSTVQVQSGELRTTAGIDSVGTFNLSAGTQLTYRSDPTILRAPTTITGDGLVSSQARVTVMGTVPIEHFDLTPSGNVNGPGTLRATSTFRWSGSEILGAGTDGPGAIEISAGSTMAITGPNGKIVRQRHIENYGTITADAGFAASQDAVVTNHIGAVFDITADVGIGVFPFEGGGRTFVNEGTLRKSAGTGEASFQMSLDQRGTVEVQSGRLTTTENFTQAAGLTTVAADATLASPPGIDVQHGTLSGSGTVAANVTNGGSVAPGSSPGTLTITGAYVQRATGSLDIEIGGTTPDRYDRLAVNGAASLDGTLNISTVDGFSPPSSSTYAILSGSPRSGTFATVNDTSGIGVAVTYGAGDVTLTAPAPPTVLSVSVDDVTKPEGSGADATDFAFAVHLSAASDQPVRVGYNTANSSAKAPGDYAAVKRSMLTFAPGETSKFVHVAVVADDTPEKDEQFLVKLAGPQGAVLGDSVATGTVQNDDALPVVSVNDVTAAEGTHPGSTPFAFTVTLSAPSTRSVTVSYRTANGDAKSPSDYASVPVTKLVFAPGETSKTVTVQVVADAKAERNEQLNVRLSAPVNTTLGRATGTATIVDDDSSGGGGQA